MNTEKIIQLFVNNLSEELLEDLKIARNEYDSCNQNEKSFKKGYVDAYEDVINTFCNKPNLI